MLECSTQWEELVEGRVQIHRVKLRRPTLRGTHRQNGTWSAAKLLPAPHFGGPPPEVIVESGLVEMFDPLRLPISTHTWREVNLSLTPTTEAPPDAAEAPADGTAIPDRRWRQLQGTCAGDGLRRVEVTGLVDTENGMCRIQGNADGLDISPELRDSLPEPLASRLAALGNLRGEAKATFRVDYDSKATVPLQYDILGELVRGRIDDRHLPNVLTELSAKLHVSNAGYEIEDLVAHSGKGTVRLACRRSGFDAASPLWLSAAVRQLDLDRSLLAILPPVFQDHWHKYLPSGAVDADVQLTFDGHVWRPQLNVRCLDVSFMYYKFPYRLQHGKGTIDLKEDRLTMKMTAYSGNQPVTLASEWTQPFDGPIGWFEAKGENLQLDDALLAALPEKPQVVARSLDPRGSINFCVQVWRDKPTELMHQFVQLKAANRCSIRYEKFPYQLSNLSGTLEMRDGVWTIRNVEATNDRARVKLDGYFGPGLEGNELVLKLTAKDVALHEELRDALSPNIQQIWRDLRPRGTIHVTADIRYLVDGKKFSVGVQAEPEPESVSIEPVRFPYRLDHLEGKLQYRDGHVTIERFKARHGDVKMSTEADCDFQSDGRWRIRFAKLWAERLVADRELTQALPERLRKATEDLKPTGPLSLSGTLEFEQTGARSQPLHSRWDVRLGMQQSNLQCGGVLVENVHGVVLLQGKSDGQHIESRGELAIDSASYRNCQFTEVAGPLWIDDGRLLFGGWVDRPGIVPVMADASGAARKPRPITAKLFGGTVYADTWVTLGVEPLYAVNATLVDADLGRCAREVGTNHKQVRGRVVATVDANGRGRSRNALSGKGTVRLSDANVYELPVMLSLLKLLSIRSPDQNAFQRRDDRLSYRGRTHLFRPH